MQSPADKLGNGEGWPPWGLRRFDVCGHGIFEAGTLGGVIFEREKAGGRVWLPVSLFFRARLCWFWILPYYNPASVWRAVSSFWAV